MAKWRITLEWVRGNWVILITRGREPVHGCATADDLQTAMSMGAELFEGCLEWPEIAPEKEAILLRPLKATQKGNDDVLDGSSVRGADMRSSSDTDSGENYGRGDAAAAMKLFTLA